jgi:MoaA/NifB/PqqE/SkfB family radical SAM enzyme
VTQHHDAPWPGRPHRLYVAVTTACNRACPWCDTASRPGKRTWLALDAFEALLPPAGPFELQLEGGEPTMHPDLLAMIDLARATGRCARVVVCTNGVALPWSAIDAWVARLGAPLTIKLSVNHHLLEADARLIDKAAVLARACDAAGAALVLNVRRRRDPAVGDDAWVVDLVERAGLLPRANVFFLQRYGLARDDARLEPPFLVGEGFTLANPDGRTFGTDLIARSDAMEALP